MSVSAMSSSLFAMKLLMEDLEILNGLGDHESNLSNVQQEHILLVRLIRILLRPDTLLEN
jgi:hypothetical protein